MHKKQEDEKRDKTLHSYQLKVKLQLSKFIKSKDLEESHSKKLSTKFYFL